MTESPTQLLFLKEYNGNRLFNSQQDLVRELIENPKSKFHVANDNKEDFIRRFITLKSFLSQLLTGRSRRVITEDFRDSLLTVLKSKNLDEHQAILIHEQIINSLRS